MAQSPSRLRAWFARRSEQIKSIIHYDWASVRREDVVGVLKSPVWRKRAAILFALLVIAYVVKNHIIAPQMKARLALPVDVIEVQPQTIPLQSQLIGQTRSPQSVVIYTRVSGFLERQVYKEGSWVKAGDVLFEMDRRPYVAQLDAAKAALAAQEAALETATLTLNRIKPLAAAKALSQQDLDNAVGNHQRAKAGVNQARANLETAQLNLDYCTIRSPISGLASVRRQALGTYLAVGSPNSELTVVNQMDPMWVYFSVSEDQILNVTQLLEQKRLNSPNLADLDVTLTLSDGSVYPYTGKIGFIDVFYNVDTGTRLTRAVFPNPNAALQQGQFVTASIVGLTQSNVYLVPQSAVQQSNKGAYVWVLDKNNEAQPRPVTPGAWNGTNWVINNGLQSGDRVVVSNVLRMSPNQLVHPNVVPAPQPQPVKLPTPPATDGAPNPFVPGAQQLPDVNQAQTPPRQPRPMLPTDRIVPLKDAPANAHKPPLPPAPSAPTPAPAGKAPQPQ